MIERAKVAVFEDNKEILEQVNIFLTGAGHEVTAEARNLSEALAVINQIEDGTTECDVVLLDANLCSSKSCGKDALVISDEIRARKLGVIVIGFSGRDMSDYDHDIRIDFDLGKRPYDVPETVDRLRQSA